MYASLYSHKLGFSIVVLNLMPLLVLYTPVDWPFISNQFFVLNLDSWSGVLSSKYNIFWYSIIVLLN